VSWIWRSDQIDFCKPWSLLFALKKNIGTNLTNYWLKVLSLLDNFLHGHHLIVLCSCQKWWQWLESQTARVGKYLLPKAEELQALLAGGTRLHRPDYVHQSISSPVPLIMVYLLEIIYLLVNQSSSNFFRELSIHCCKQGISNVVTCLNETLITGRNDEEH